MKQVEAGYKSGSGSVLAGQVGANPNVKGSVVADEINGDGLGKGRSSRAVGQQGRGGRVWTRDSYDRGSDGA